MTNKNISIHIMITLTSLSSLLYAEQSTNSLLPIQVYADSSVHNVTMITSQQIEKTPLADANIANLLKQQSSVRTALGGENGHWQGEIAPSNLSFYGERYYNNRFTLNGVSLNNNINPIGMGKEAIVDKERTDTIALGSLPPGHSQALWVSPHLLEKVEIYDHNVASEWGEFTGAEINATLKTANPEKNSGSVAYRTTRDRWYSYHLDGQDRKEFEQAYSPLAQPKFIKHQYNLQLNQVISPNAALLFAYDRQQSRIPLQQRYLNKWQKQRRLAENYLLSYYHRFDPNHQFTASLLYAPYSGTYFLDNAIDGRFSEKGGGWLALANWQYYSSYGLLSTSLSYRDNKNQTVYDASTLYRYTKTPSINWISNPLSLEATQGGIGKQFTQQRQIQLQQKMEFTPIYLANSQHKITLGWDFQYNTSALRQPNEAQQYHTATCFSYANNPNNLYECEVVAKTPCQDCIAGEQYFAGFTIYPKISGQVSHHRSALYFQDKIRWQKLVIVPGIRLDYSQFTRQLNIAPRFYLDYDVFNNDHTHLITGYNRYYAGDLTDYKLRSYYQFHQNYIRYNANEDWQSTDNYEYPRYLTPHKLKTPYSDEYNLAIQQKIANTLWTLKWVQRQPKDQLMTEVDSSTTPHKRWFVNKGKGKTHNLSLEINNIAMQKTAWFHYDWKIGLSYQKSTSNQTNDYTQRNWDMYNIDKVLIGNQLRSIDNIPALDFNTPWTGYINLSLFFPRFHLHWEQQLNYLSSYKQSSLSGLRCSPQISACGHYQGLVAHYQQTKYKRNIKLDWHFNWKYPIKNHHLSVNLTVLNVLNRIAKSQTVSEDYGLTSYQTYQPGRQFWLGMKYEW